MKKTMITVAGLSLAVLLSSCSGSADTGGGQTVPAGQMTSAGPAAEADGSSSFEDGVLTTSDMIITITSHKVIPVGARGNEYGKKPVLAFWYKTTNVSGKKMSPMDFIMTITATQDNDPNRENKLQVGALPDERFLRTQMENIKKGGTVENAIAYELDDEVTPVQLAASADLGMSTIGTITYPLK